MRRSRAGKNAGVVSNHTVEFLFLSFLLPACIGRVADWLAVFLLFKIVRSYH